MRQNTKLTTAVKTYFVAPRRVRASGGATGERSSYGLLTGLLNAIGADRTEGSGVADRIVCSRRAASGRSCGGGAPSLYAVRTALEEALGIRFKDECGARFFHSTLAQTLFYGVFSAWVLWTRSCSPTALADGPPGNAGVPPASFNWREAVWYLRAPIFCRRCSSRYPTLGGSTRWGLSKSWPRPPRPSTAWTAPPSSPASMQATSSRASTNPSWEPSISPCANSWASGTCRQKSCATWSPAWTRR